MTLEISLKSTLDPTFVDSPFPQFVNDLNMAAAKGMQFVIATEMRDDGQRRPVAFETRNITRIRELDEEHAFIGN